MSLLRGDSATECSAEDLIPVISGTQWYAVLLEATRRLNRLIDKSDPSFVSAVFDNFLLCGPQTPIDMLQIGESYLTNMCAVLNAMLAFRDTKGLTYRIVPIHDLNVASSCFRVKQFAVLAGETGEDDADFPLLSD